MNASVIISVYKNTKALEAVLDSLLHQTMMPKEVIVSEDGESKEMRECVANYIAAHSQADSHDTLSLLPFALIHLTQDDKGWRKNRALNRAIMASTTDYLIFVDGDCLLHPHFVEEHISTINYQLSTINYQPLIVAGKRVKLNEELSTAVLNGSLTISQLPARLLPRLFNRKGCRYVEEAYYLPCLPKRKVKHITGCNMSMPKQALLDINGFDENYILPAVGEDYDIEWRLLAKGYKIVSARNRAIVYHLYHKENWNEKEQTENLRYCRVQEANNNIVCKNGINMLP